MVVGSVQGFVVLSRYVAGRVVRQRQGVTTYSGVDRTEGHEVVINTVALELLPGSVRKRLQRDAEVLVGLRPRPPMLAWTEQDGLFCLVTPHVEGRPLAERLAREQLSPREAVSIASAVMQALAAVHRQGVLHRNLTPSSVVVRGGDEGDEVVLVDFGISPVELMPAAAHELSVEAIRYVSPEQSGLLRQPVDHRSDLYTAGLLLYECLAGRLPFDGSTVGTLLQQQLNLAPPSLRALGIDVPCVLEQLVLRLLQKEPVDRYQSAEAADSDLLMIERVLAGAEIDPPPVIGRSDLRAALTKPAIVGRREELQRLDQAVVRTRLGEGGVLLLEGESGTGKTVVLEELARRTAASGHWLLRGEAMDQPVRRPFQLLEGVVEEVKQRALEDPNLIRRIRKAQGDLLPALCRALPALGPVLGSHRSRESDTIRDAGERPLTRTQLALGRFIASLGSRERCAVLLLDDCQWCDELLAGALQQLQSTGEATHTLVVMACRAGESPTLHDLHPMMRVTLPPMEAGEIQQLLESMAGPLPADVLALVLGVCGGNPFMAVAILWGLVETDALVPAERGWRLVQQSLAHVQSSRRTGTILARRIDGVPKPTRALLEAGAVLGMGFQIDQLAAVADLPQERALALLGDARRRHLLWSDPRGGWHFSHRLLLEHLLAGLDEATARRLHLRAAVHLQDQDRQGHGEAAFLVAYHLDAAGRSTEALPYALEAAEQARGQDALDVAMRQYQIAARGASRADRATRRRVATGLGDVLLARNEHVEAGRQLRLALELCEDDATRASIQRELGRLAFRRGDNRQASEALEQGLRLAGNPVPGSWWGVVRELAREVITREARSLRSRRSLSAPPEPEGLELLTLSLHTHLPVVWWHDRGLVPALWSHYFRLNRAERYPGSAELGIAYAFQGRLLAALSLFDRAEPYLRLSEEIGAGLEDAWSKGHILFMQALVLYASARFDAAREKLEPGIQLLEQAGDAWQALLAQGILGCVHLRQGDLARAAVIGRQLHEQGVERDQALPASAGLDVWSKASGGRLPAALTRAELRRAGTDVLRRSFVQQAEAVRLLREGEPDRAATTLEQAWRDTGRARIRSEHVFPIPGWLLTTLRVWASSLAEGTKQRARLLARAKRLAARGRLLARRFPNHRPHVLRESGLVAAMLEDFPRAREWLRLSQEHARSQGARHELAQSLLADARVGRVLGLPGAADHEREGVQLLDEVETDFVLGEVLAPRQEEPRFEAPATVSLMDRFDQLLEAGHRIVTSLSQEAAFVAVREAAARLLRGQQCLVLEVSGAVAHPVSGEADVALSMSLVSEAMRSGVPVTAASGAPVRSVQVSESFVLSGVRSVLVAPIPQRDGLRFCIYVTHGQIGGLFGEEEQKLAAFIASLAGAALENATNYRELELAFDGLNRAHGELKSTQAQLVQAAKLAALGQLGAGIAHELNQPIQSIQGFAQRIQRDPEAAIQQHLDELKIIESASKRMARIVQNIRLFARDSELELRPLDPITPVREALMLLSQQLDKLGIAVEWQQRGELPMVTGDLVKLQQVFLNLILNSKDALDTLPPDARRQITFGAAVEGDCVRLTVADTGPGVPPELESSIFDPFFTTKAAGQGTGLGLSISYGIIKEHGGELMFERSQEGALFSVALPLDGVR